MRLLAGFSSHLQPLAVQLGRPADCAMHMGMVALQAPCLGGAARSVLHLGWVIDCASSLGEPQAVFSNQAELYAGFNCWMSWQCGLCKVIPQAGLHSYSGQKFRPSGYLGPKSMLNSWAGLLTWLPSGP